MATITLTGNPTTEAEELGNGNLLYVWSAIGIDWYVSVYERTVG
jgi:hypothetical protein